MKAVTDEVTEIWQSGDFVGPDRRPMARVTVQRMHIGQADYHYPKSRSATWDHDGVYTHALFGQDAVPRELFNIKSVTWTRNVDQDIATCSIKLYNSQYQPVDQPAANDVDFDQPGFYTPNRGDDPFFASRWNYEANHWHSWLVPDRLVRTYEGYGLDNDYPPDTDPHMYPSGVWLIDTVSLDTEGYITLDCRDMGRLLLDQIAMPPVIPAAIYPLGFEKFAPGTGTYAGQTIGNYADYTDVVKILCAWGGFWWPPAGSGRAFVKYAGLDAQHALPPLAEDPVLIKGAVWGDFMQTGTTGIANLGVETFDKRPLMDGVSSIRETIGFDFWIDETGAVVWRLPNIYRKGSYLMPVPGGSRSTRETDVVVIDERSTLMSLTMKLDSTNVRSRVFVANIGGNYGATVKGYNPYPSGIRRVAGWTDQNFQSALECQRMAEMIAFRQAVTYRQGSLTVAANPSLQIDDQVRIYERTTGEGYLHRITGITSTFDNEDGTWTYDLSTHWLGDEPFTNWAFDTSQMSDVTRHFLHDLGAIDG